jgi:hypothetical protein
MIASNNDRPKASFNPTIRYAIYTRKASEDGLEQEFIYLDASALILNPAGSMSRYGSQRSRSPTCPNVDRRVMSLASAWPAEASPFFRQPG